MEILIVATMFVVGVSVLQFLHFRKTRAKMEAIKRSASEIENESKKLKVDCT